MPTYTPNAFSGQMAQANALRSYAPNAFSGKPGSTMGSMASHLSVPESERPYASDIALLRGGGYGGNLPNLDAIWRAFPNRYASQVGGLLSDPQAAGALAGLKDPTLATGLDYDNMGLPAGYRQIVDDEGNTRIVRSGQYEGSD